LAFRADVLADSLPEGYVLLFTGCVGAAICFGVAEVPANVPSGVEMTHIGLVFGRGAKNWNVILLCLAVIRECELIFERWNFWLEGCLRMGMLFIQNQGWTDSPKALCLEAIYAKEWVREIPLCLLALALRSCVTSECESCTRYVT
jgi:hypothetical protein